jgi:hypothetical protein
MGGGAQLDFSKAQPLDSSPTAGAQPQSGLDFSKAQPLSADTTAAAQPSLNDRLTQPTSDDFAKQHPILSAISNFGGGVLHGAEQVVAHPYDSAVAAFQQAKDILPTYTSGGIPLPNRAGIQRAQEQAQEVVAHPAYAAGNLTGGYLAGEGAGKVLGVVPKVARAGADIIAGTGKAAPELVADTASSNAAAQAAADAANAKATQLRAQQLQQHFERTQAANEANTASSAAQSRKAALQRGVETLDPIHKTDLQNLEGTVRAEANRRYNELNGTLDPEPAPPELASSLLSDASEAMKGSNTETPIMKDLERRMNSGDTLTYRDLQGYRSEIGAQLQKGTLPGDVYHAYTGMMDSITDAMKDIADSRGMGDQFDQARSYYKQMSDTFDDPRSPIRKALNSTEVGGVVKAFAGKDKSGIEALAQYDPDLAQRINTTRGYAAEAKSIKSSSTAPVKFGGPTGTAQTAADTVEPPKPPTTPDLTQVGPSDIQQAKATDLAARATSMRKVGAMGHLASGFLAYDLAKALMKGDVGHAAMDIGARVGVSAGQHVAAAALEHPAVVNWLTQPTAADLAELAKLPPEQRVAAAQSLQSLIDAATARGIRVAPAISGILAVGNSLPPNHALAQAPTQ